MVPNHARYQTALHPVIYNANNIINKPRKSQGLIICFYYLQKVFAKFIAMIYNAFSDGAWCSGSTWASDSHCVGSIPIAPANANPLTSVRGLFYLIGEFQNEKFPYEIK